MVRQLPGFLWLRQKNRHFEGGANWESRYVRGGAASRNDSKCQVGPAFEQQERFSGQGPLAKTPVRSFLCFHWCPGLAINRALNRLIAKREDRSHGPKAQGLRSLSLCTMVLFFLSMPFPSTKQQLTCAPSMPIFSQKDHPARAPRYFPIRSLRHQTGNLTRRLPAIRFLSFLAVGLVVGFQSAH